MPRLAFTMKLISGKTEEYKARHDNLWPELSTLLKEFGISDYYIYLDENTGVLYGNYQVSNVNMLEKLPRHPVMQRWWLYMADIMESNPDHSPVSAPLKEMFYLP